MNPLIERNIDWMTLGEWSKKNLDDFDSKKILLIDLGGRNATKSEDNLTFNKISF